MDAESNTSGVSLAGLFARRQFFQASDVVVSACCTDHRRCRPGDLYVALLNADLDGHDYVQDAIANGATAVLSERLLPLQVPQCIVPSTKAALARLCQHLVGDPGTEIPIVGVAGKRGIAPTQTLVTRMLRGVGQKPASFGASGYTDGFDAYSRAATRASSAQYARWLANALANGCSEAVTELPQQEVANRIYSNVPFQTLVLTGFESNTHRNVCTPKVQSYLTRTISQVPPEGLIVVNADCPVLRNLIGAIDRPTLTVSMEGPADVTANLLEQFPSEQTFLLDAGTDTAVVRTKIIGDPFVRQCLLVAATGMGMGYDLSSIVAAIESIESIPGYLERVECGQRFSVFADAAANPLDLQQTLTTLRTITSGRLYCVFGQGDTASHALRALRGKTAERFADLGVITSDDPVDHEPLRAAHDVLDGYRDPSKAHVMPHRTHAIEWTLGQAQPGDTVVLAGPHNGRLVRDEDGFLSDADVARNWLYESAKSLGLDWMIAPQ